MRRQLQRGEVDTPKEIILKERKLSETDIRLEKRAGLRHLEAGRHRLAQPGRDVMNQELEVTLLSVKIHPGRDMMN